MRIIKEYTLISVPVSSLLDEVEKALQNNFIIQGIEPLLTEGDDSGFPSIVGYNMQIVEFIDEE